MAFLRLREPLEIPFQFLQRINAASVTMFQHLAFQVATFSGLQSPILRPLLSLRYLIATTMEMKALLRHQINVRYVDRITNCEDHISVIVAIGSLIITSLARHRRGSGYGLGDEKCRFEWKV